MISYKRRKANNLVVRVHPQTLEGRKIVKYYRVLRKFDGLRTFCGKCLIANELFTVSELSKLGISPGCCVPVMISKCNVYISFGARFEVGTDQSSVL